MLSTGGFRSLARCGASRHGRKALIMGSAHPGCTSARRASMSTSPSRLSISTTASWRRPASKHASFTSAAILVKERDGECERITISDTFVAIALGPSTLAELPGPTRCCRSTGTLAESRRDAQAHAISRTSCIRLKFCVRMMCGDLRALGRTRGRGL